MSAPIVALKNAMKAHLATDTALLALIREPKIYADPPRHAAFPHLAFVAAEARENGTSSDDGHLIDMTLGVWNRHGGSAEGLAVAAAVSKALETLPPQLAGHRLVNLIVRAVEPQPLKDGETWRTSLRLRAVTEVTI
ncbi:MAG: DUF3168 domain-containing protein [Beijerinckiaceae bacterium]